MTQSFYVELTLRVVEDGQPADVAGHIDALMDAFEDVEWITDVDLAADLKAATVQFCIHLPAVDAESALRQAIGAARTAVHAAGHGTPGWESAMAGIFDTGQYKSMVQPADFDRTGSGLVPA